GALGYACGRNGGRAHVRFARGGPIGRAVGYRAGGRPLVLRHHHTHAASGGTRGLSEGSLRDGGPLGGRAAESSQRSATAVVSIAVAVPPPVGAHRLAVQDSNCR